jgi:hypothetical protein
MLGLKVVMQWWNYLVNGDYWNSFIFKGRKGMSAIHQGGSPEKHFLSEAGISIRRYRHCSLLSDFLLLIESSCLSMMLMMKKKIKELKISTCKFQVQGTAERTVWLMLKDWGRMENRRSQR